MSQPRGDRRFAFGRDDGARVAGVDVVDHPQDVLRGDGAAAINVARQLGVVPGAVHGQDLEEGPVFAARYSVSGDRGPEQHPLRLAVQRRAERVSDAVRTAAERHGVIVDRQRGIGLPDQRAVQRIEGRGACERSRTGAADLDICCGERGWIELAVEPEDQLPGRSDFGATVGPGSIDLRGFIPGDAHE